MTMEQSIHRHAPVGHPRAEILIVDDTPANIQVLTDTLRNHGYSPRIALNGTLAIQSVQIRPPDLILLDITMPDMDGYTVCERLKAMTAHSAIPVIFISALNETLDKVRAFQVGGVDYLTKPFQIDEVLARINAHLTIQNLQRELTRQNLSLEDTVRERTRQLAEANERLKTMDQVKSDFLRIISHELRTPLNGVFGIVELLLADGSKDPRTLQYHRMFTDAQRRMMRLLEDALLLTQVQTASPTQGAEQTPLSQALKKALAESAVLAQARNIPLPPLPDTDAVIHGHGSLTAKALGALIETAVKFAVAAPIVISISETPKQVLLEIRATGRAIPADCLPDFFEIFRVAKAVVPGGDIGLEPPLARRLLSLFEGTVDVRNLEAPDGVCFSVTLSRVGH